MKDPMGILELITTSFAACATLASRTGTKESSTTASSASDQTQAPPDVQAQRKEAEKESKKTLDKEAIAAIAQTRNAVNAIAANKNDDALAAIEHATGKINILLARNPATALIPGDLEVQVIDTAPHDTQAIREIAQDVSKAVDDKDFPAARALLYSLMSEIRVRTYNLPLATYPEALKQAARLLDQKATTDASTVLRTALNTLVVIDRITPLPLVLAREAINQVREKSRQDKSAAQSLLEIGKKEVERARELGYSGKDLEYTALNNDISALEKRLKGNEDPTAVLSKLKEKLNAFLKHQSDRQRG